MNSNSGSSAVPTESVASGEGAASVATGEGGSHEASAILDVRVHVDPVCVSGWPDAHIVRFLAGNQRFDIGDAWETRDEALLYAHLFSTAIARDFGLNAPAASRVQYMPPANEARAWVDDAFPSGTYTAGSMRTAYVAGWQSAKGLRAAVDEAARQAGPLLRPGETDSATPEHTDWSLYTSPQEPQP